MSKRQDVAGRQETVIFRVLTCITALSVLLILGVVMYITMRGWRALVEDLMGAILGTESSILLPLFWETVYVIVGATLLALPFGLGMAIYLSEYALHSPLALAMRDTIDNLAKVPPIVYGLFGWGALARGQKGASWSVIVLTLSIWMLPKVATITLRTLEQIPLAFRRESQALGASRWQTSIHAVLPCGRRQIASDILKAMARLTGEVTPLIMLIGVEPTFGFGVPKLLSYHVYYSLIDYLRWNQAMPYGAVLLLLMMALLLQLLGVMIEPARQQTVDYLGNQVGKGW
ncbi:MAG: ABC transporter permease subunit [Firmicutes bacterium]|nr:ABC transporter permease subunit [Bacillota bacterium]